MFQRKNWSTVLLGAILLLLYRSVLAETGDHFFREGRFKEAVAAFRFILRGHPQDITVRLNLVRALLRLDGNYWPYAVEEAQQAVQKAPKNAEAHGLYALALMRGGYVERAQVEAERALAYNPDSYYGLVARGRIAFWNGDIKGAFAYFQRAIELYPDRDMAYAYWLTAVPNEESTSTLFKKYFTSYLRLHPMGHPHTELLQDMAQYQSQEKQPPKNSRSWVGAAASQATYAEKGEGPPVSYDLPIEWVDQLIALPVTINGVALSMVLDTGAGDGVVLTHSAIERLGLKPIGQMVTRGVRGSEVCTTYRADTVQVGPEVLQNCDIVSVHEGAVPVDGIIGGALFKDSAVTIDFQKNLCTISYGKEAGAPPCEEGDILTSVPFHLYQNYIFVPVLLADNTHPQWALLDTGADPLGILSLITARQLAKQRSVDSYREIELPLPLGVGSKAGTFRALLFAFSVDLTLFHPKGNLFLMQLDPILGASILEDLSEDFDIELSALIGMPFLAHAKRVTLDYPHKILTMEFSNS